MSSFLETFRARQANAGAAATEGFRMEDTPFVTPDMTPPPAVVETPVEAPEGDVVVVVTPEDTAVSPDADIEEGAVIESLVAAECAAEQFGWSAGLLDFMGRRGLLAGTSLEGMSFENYSMEAEGGEVGEAVSGGIATRIKDWSGRVLGKIRQLWDHVSAKLTGAENEVDAAAEKGVSDEPRRAIPYKTVAAVVATIAAAGAAIYVMVKHVDFSALQKAGALDKAGKAIDDALAGVARKVPKLPGDKTFFTADGLTAVRRKFIRAPGAILPKAHEEIIGAASHSRALMVVPQKAGWTAGAVRGLGASLKEAHKTLSGAVSGLYKAAKNPGAVVDGAMANPAGAAHAAGKFAVVSFVGAVVAAVSWLLYHVVVKGVNLVRSAVRAVTGSSSED